MEWFVWLLWFLIFSFSALSIQKKLLPEIPSWAIFSIWTIKILAGTALWAIYMNYYTGERTGDIISYHRDGLELLHVWQESPKDYVKVLLGLENNLEERYAHYYNNMRYWYEEWKGSNLIIEFRNMVRLSSVVGLLTGGLVHSHTLFYSFFSLVGALFLAGGLSQRLPQLRQDHLLAGLVLLPSVLAWTSAIMRESPMMLGLGLGVYGTVSLKQKRILAGLLTLIFGYSFLILFKTHVALTLTLPLLLYLASGSSLKQALMVHTLGVAGFLIMVFYTPPGALILHIVDKKRENFLNVAEVWEARSRVPVPEVPQNPWDAVPKAFHALFNTFLQPLPWRVRGIMDGLAVLENLLFLVLLSLTLIRWRKLRGIEISLILFLTGFALWHGLLVGFTTSVAGAIVRYKVPALVMMVPLFVAALGPSRNKT